MQISPHFHLSEFTTSQTADRRGIDNTPPDWAIVNLTRLCDNVLEPVRRHFGRPVVISSGWRSRAVNAAVGGVASSQHCKGEAADFEVPGVSNVKVAQWIRSAVAFDQLILEFYRPGEPNSGWVHCSYATGNRYSVMTAARVGGITKYLGGLVE